MIGGRPYSESLTMIVIAAAAVPWLLTLLLAAILPANRKGYGVRRIDVFVIVFSIAFGIAWFAGMLYPQGSRAVAARRSASPARSCVTIKAGQTEAKVRELLGNPDEIRSEEEVRGPGADVWVYRDIRCAVHTMTGSVIAVE